MTSRWRCMIVAMFAAGLTAAATRAPEQAVGAWPGRATSTSSNSVAQGVMFSITSDETIEWIVADSDVIVRGTIVSADAKEIVVDVRETLKNPAGTLDAQRLRIGADRTFTKSIVAADALVFLRNTAKGLVLRQGRGVVLPLDGIEKARTMDLQILTRPEEVMDAARRALAQPATRRSIDIWDNWAQMGPKRQVRLHVPVIPRLEELGLRWVADSDATKKLLGIHALQPFRSDRNVAVLKAMLGDRSVTRVYQNNGKWQRGFYGVRLEAHLQLRDWGVYVPEPELTGPALAYRPPVTSWVWLLVLPGIAVGWGIVLWAGACLVARRAGRPTAFNWHRGIMSGITVVSLLLAVAAGWIWLRSHVWVDEAIYQVGSTCHQVASYRGGVQYLAAGKWTSTTGTLVGSFNLQQVDDAWSFGALAPTASRSAAGFCWADGTTRGPDGLLHPYSMFRVPYWFVLMVFLVLPMRPVFRFGRRWRRRRRGQCPCCGYDLRASSPSGLCPECGHRAAGASGLG
ncbi:MAG: hypothetical protein ACHRHE_00725 [Tepidisphaerales bacterium]